jgi:hypothetical protein
MQYHLESTLIRGLTVRHSNFENEWMRAKEVDADCIKADAVVRLLQNEHSGGG